MERWTSFPGPRPGWLLGLGVGAEVGQVRKKVRLGNREGKVIIMSVEQDSLVTRKEENISLGGGGSSGATDVGSMGETGGK